MHRMHKALVFNNRRLSRRFLCICMLLIGAFAFSFPAVEGHADGSLKLNTDVLMNNGGDIGGTGDFPIRGQLFSSEIEEQNKKLHENQAEVGKHKKTIDFKEKSTESLNTKSMTNNLFHEYQPQVITTAESTGKKDVLSLYILIIVGGIVLTFLGILVGNRRVKRKRRRRSV